MITVKVLLGKDTVSIYKKTGNIPPEESTTESGGYTITRHFDTEAEYKAYAMAVEDLDGHEDWQMLAPSVMHGPSFRQGDFVRLTAEAVDSVRRDFGDNPADYRKGMLLEVKYSRQDDEGLIVGARDIREDDIQEFNATFLRPLTAEDLLEIASNALVHNN